MADPYVVQVFQETDEQRAGICAYTTPSARFCGNHPGETRSYAA